MSARLGGTSVRNRVDARACTPAAADCVGRRRAVQAGQHQQLIAKRLERLQDRRELEAGAFGCRRPLLHHHAVRHVDDAEPPDRLRGVVGGGKRRHHAVEQRQRQRGAEAAQDACGAASAFFGDDHDSALLIWNGMLLTMPRMIDDQR